MNTCESHNNCVVVYNNRYCPLCEVEKDNANLEKKHDELVSELIDIKDELSNLQYLVEKEAPQLLY